MNQIGIKLTGLPGVFEEGQKIDFPLKKAEALIYYLALEGESTREQLRALLWPESDEESALKSLRNTLYIVRKTLGENFILSPNNTRISINPTYCFRFEDNYETPEDLITDGFELLKSYSFKGDEEFQNWLGYKREDFKSTQIKNLTQKCSHLIKEGQSSEAIQVLEALLRIDPYSEDTARQIMELYLGLNKFNKAISVYNKLANTLREDLGVVPDTNSTALYESIVTLRNLAEKTSNKKKTEYFFGRYDEMTLIKEEIDRFLLGFHSKHILIEGEAGIGKTRLVERAIQGYSKANVIKVNCTFMENDLPFRPWHFLLREIYRNSKPHEEVESKFLVGGVVGTDDKWKNDFDKYSLEGAQKISFQELVEDVTAILNQYTSEKKLILIFEDLHWAQGNSLQLLLEVVREKLDKVLFIITSREVKNQTMKKFQTLGENEDWLIKLPLSRYSKTDAKTFLVNGTEKSIQKEWFDLIYKESEGNTYMLKVYLDLINKEDLDNLTPIHFEALMRSNLIGLSEKAARVLDILSVFKEYPDFEGLKAITIYDDIEIVEIIDELKDQHVIQEITTSSRLYYDFTHHKLKEFVFGELSETRKIVIHRKICIFYKDKFRKKNTNIAILPYIIYHARHSRDFLIEYKYQVIYGKMYLDVWHEVFSAYYDGLNKEQTFEDKILSDIEETRQRLISTLGIDDNTRYYDYQVMFIKGRRAIREGQYEEGLTLIDTAEKYFEKNKKTEQLVNCLLQKIYHAIQISDTVGMNQALYRLDNIIRHGEFPDLIYVYWRLKGLYYLKLKHFIDAERYFGLAIEYLKPMQTENLKYALNLAATYNYMAEIKMINGNYEQAIELLKLAKDHAEKARPTNGLALIYTNLALSYYDYSKIEPSLNYIAKAIEAYDLTGSFWGRGRAEAHLSRMMYLADFKDSAHEHMSKALRFAHRMMNPDEMAYVDKICKEVKYEA